MIRSPEFYIHTHYHHGHHGRLTVGEELLVGNDVKIDLTGNVKIGDYVTFSNGVKIMTHKHKYSHSKKIRRENQVITPIDLEIEDDVFLGEDSMILGVSKIGQGAIIGARAVVTKNIPEYEIWAGNPAVKIGERRDENA